MPASPYALRIQRAEELSRDLPFAREILRFYIHLAEFQEKLHRSLATQNASPTLTRDLTAAEFSQLAPHFDPFLAVAETHGPAPLSHLSRELRSQSDPRDLLAHAWLAHSADDAPTLLAQIFLQPYAELLRARATPEQHRHAYALCPYCNRKPGIGVMRQQGDGGARSLVCTFCHAEWNFLRIACPACGEMDERKIAVYTAAESFPHIRVECCETCKTYLKTIDLTKNGHADPVVDELSSAPLDLWAQDHTYQKLHANLLGM
jgi:FdhE protein